MNSLRIYLAQLTTYRLMRYYLGGTITLAFVLSYFAALPYNPWFILFNSLFFIALCHSSNLLLAKVFKTQAHADSAIISGMILALLFTPYAVTENLLAFTIASLGAMTSKYLLVWNKGHVFNPAATGAVISAVATGTTASWWVGDVWLLPVVLVGGYLVVWKLRRQTMVLTFILGFLLVAVLTQLRFSEFSSDVLWQSVANTLTGTPLLFFATVMLIEPLTSPATPKQRLGFVLVVLVASVIFGTLLSGISFPLELALLTGNIYAAATRKVGRLNLKLREAIQLSGDIYKFVFTKPAGFKHTAGQFLEWTLNHPHPDKRGVRRYFTISSSPTEESILLTTKFASNRSSTFKQALKELVAGDEIVAANLEGDFVLPVDQKRPLVMIAGGIGITPFRAMAKFLIDSNQERDVILLYSVKTRAEIVYDDIFQQAEKLGWRTCYVLTDEKPAVWPGRTGFIDERLIKEEVADWQKRTFYVSGPEPMVEAFEKMLAKMGIKDSQIMRDFFPGYTETHQKS